MTPGQIAVRTCPVALLSGVGRTFPGNPPVEALRDVDLCIEAGDFVSIMGPSGSGKSTLLHLLGLLDTPTDGRLNFLGRDTTALNEQDRALERARRIGFVFQAFHLLPHRTAVENVMLADVHARGARRDRRHRAVEALTGVGLAHRVDALARNLSGGELQRTAIARALIGNPTVLLADEPTGNLDADNASAVMEVFHDLHDRGLTIVMITHDREVAEHAQHLVRIEDGRLK